MTSLVTRRVVLFRCLRCGKEWPSKQARPVRCPECKHPAWDTRGPKRVKRVAA